METVINPIYFYLIGIVDKLINLGVIGLLVCWIVIIALSMRYMWEAEFYSEKSKETLKIVKQYLPKLLIYQAICVAIITLTPSSTTVIQMVIAKNITIDRVQDIQDIVSKVYIAILNIVNK